MPLTEETRAAAADIIARYPSGHSRSALLPLLHLVQAEDGCVTSEGVEFCASLLGITQAEVSAVATFYTMYKRRPVGDWLVSVCTNLSCALLGGEEVYARLSQELGVGHDQTTADGTITLEHAECLAACDYAPVLTVNYEFFDQVDPQSASEIVEALRRGERPAPTRGAPLCTFAEASRQLAGLPDPRPEAVAGPGVGEPSVAGLLVTGTADATAAGPAGSTAARGAPANGTPAKAAPAKAAPVRAAATKAASGKATPAGAARTDDSTKGS
ncbi:MULTISPECIES: NADH-quinone oxidoreductase subunit NuoE [Protofrankia]|uniref:NADH-quinone oxidoreductase, E subunit n=1 Tax=Candidatus Protofrankia datiscae TaxID=2716812 RepID=F8AVH4_9ACTN|nr:MULTISPECIES: NADH-quinone oxidoreductase subunit NuoE [Protofrankia]AEH11278.1 NADH-quinone oxidoreductase, E subunit [Candidatus Protofrankia datiscae]